MKLFLKVAIIMLTISVLSGCSKNNQTEPESGNPDEAPVIFEIPVPTASGINVEANDRARIDYSNIQDGYVIAVFTGKSDKIIRVAVTAPHGERYIYTISDGDVEEIIPLTEGDGEYLIGIYEQAEGSEYNSVVEITIDVILKDDFVTFLHPNQFVNYTKRSELVELAAELTRDAESTGEKIDAIYNYIVDNFTYDYDRAANVQSGYIPNLDDVLHKKEGICFDYSALVTAMFRSQGIPTRLEIGYHGEEYHAWISKYCEENGWMERRYHHDGEEWCMMDPTIESGERKIHLSRQEARNDDEYRLMYNY